ncbi:MAG: hypothetical protein JST00_34440 [Deltaproteobacteria bacterium]|nr:hypothetical protein [Deltaproteobacteria bacterium]
MLLAVAAERMMTGTFTFGHGDGRSFLTMRDGEIANVALPPGSGVAYLGTILYETGIIDSDVLDQTLLEVATTRRLHGEVLVAGGFVSRQERDDALVEQTCRRIHRLFGLPEDTVWRFETDTSAADSAKDAARPGVDPWRALWRGLRDQPVSAHVRRTLAKLDGPMQLRDARMLARYDFDPEELAFAWTLVDRPMTLVEALHTSELDGERTQLVIYALALGRLLGKPRVVAPVPTELGVDGIRARATSIDNEAPHQVLGLPTNASPEASRAAYLRLSKAWNPDRLPADLACVRLECEHVFARLELAYRTLTERREMHTPVVHLLSLRMDMPENVSDTPPAKTMRDVDAALAESRLDDAMIVARELSIAGTEGPTARAVIAWCESRAGAASREVIEKSLATIDRILAGDPSCVRALLYRGTLTRKLGRDEEAMRDFRRVLRLDPSNADANHELRAYETISGEMPKVDLDDDAPATGPRAPGPASHGSGLHQLLGRVARR